MVHWVDDQSQLHLTTGGEGRGDISDTDKDVLRQNVTSAGRGERRVSPGERKVVER